MKKSSRSTVSYCFPGFPGALLGFPGSPGVRSQKVGEFEEVGEGSRKLEKARGVWRKLQEVGESSKTFEKVRESWRRFEEVIEGSRKLEKVRGSW